MPKTKQVKAFELDPDKVGGNDSHPFTFGDFPGLWQVGRAVRPEALGLNVTTMRELIDRFNLPLLEVTVDEKDAHTEFAISPLQIPAGRSVSPIQDPAPMIEVNGGLITGPLPSARMPKAAEAAGQGDAAEGDAEGAADSFSADDTGDAGADDGGDGGDGGGDGGGD